MRPRHDFSGMALPYDVLTRRAFRRWVFATGSIETDFPVPLLRDHDNAQRLGQVRRALNWPSGLFVFGRAFDELPEGTPLSAGFTVLAAQRRAGVFVVLKAKLEEISVVRRAAFGVARVEGRGRWPDMLART